MRENIRAICRIIDVNLNRLREGLRVTEEYFRFICNNKAMTIRLKRLRHRCRELEAAFDRHSLLCARNTKSDPLSKGCSPEEIKRNTVTEVFFCNIKRAQEAARVIEEYSKLCARPNATQTAKTLRFSLYKLEKDVMEFFVNDRKKKG